MEKNLYTKRQRILLNLLRSVRKEAKLRQKDLAKILDRPQSFVSKYESGERRLDILEIYDICLALGVTLGDLSAKLELALDQHHLRNGTAT